MDTPKTIGFPRMMKEPSETRVFLPDFVQILARMGLEVFIEEGYGSRGGFSFDDYRQGSLAVHECSRPDAFQRDLVLVLRSPKREAFSLLPPGCCLISMLHLPTRPSRVERLRKAGVRAISLDGIADDNNLRLVENMKAVAWNGLEAAFDWLGERWPGLRHPDQRPFRVLILGAGMVGKHAVEAATKFGNVERSLALLEQGAPGVLVTTVGRNISGDSAVMERLLRDSDILVDATQRRDASRPLVPNAWLAWMPDHAVIVDLSVDPYTLDTHPPVVRGVEGIPQGNLDQYVFPAEDPRWDLTVPPQVPSANRRTTVSCYSWPGIHPEACMRHYAQQLEPLMEALVAKGYEGLSLEGGYFERALFRGTLKYWLQHSQYPAKSRL
jgi:alanine dehydrogenase